MSSFSCNKLLPSKVSKRCKVFMRSLIFETPHQMIPQCITFAKFGVSRGWCLLFCLFVFMTWWRTGKNSPQNLCLCSVQLSCHFIFHLAVGVLMYFYTIIMNHHKSSLIITENIFVIFHYHELCWDMLRQIDIELYRATFSLFHLGPIAELSNLDSPQQDVGTCWAQRASPAWSICQSSQRSASVSHQVSIGLLVLHAQKKKNHEVCMCLFLLNFFQDLPFSGPRHWVIRLTMIKTQKV